MNSNDSRKKYKHVRVESSESSSDPESEVVRRVDKRVATARKLEVPSDPESDSATEVRNQSFEEANTSDEDTKTLSSLKEKNKISTDEITESNTHSRHEISEDEEDLDDEETVVEERRQHEDVDMGEDETTTEYDTVVGSESLDGLTADFSDEDSTLLTLTNTTLTDDEEDEHNVQQHNERTPLYLEEKEKEKERDKSWHSATDDDDEGRIIYSEKERAVNVYEDEEEEEEEEELQLRNRRRSSTNTSTNSKSDKELEGSSSSSSKINKSKKNKKEKDEDKKTDKKKSEKISKKKKFSDLVSGVGSSSTSKGRRFLSMLKSNNSEGELSPRAKSDNDSDIRVTPPPTPSPLAPGLVIDVEKLKKSPRQHKQPHKSSSPHLRHQPPHSPHSPQSPHTKIAIHESFDQSPRLRSRDYQDPSYSRSSSFSSPSSSSSSAPPTPSPTHTSLQKRSAVIPPRTVNLQPTIAVLPVHSGATYAFRQSTSSSSSSSTSHSLAHTGTFAAMNPKSGSKHNASKTKEKTKAKTKLTKAKTKTNGKELPPIPLEVVDLGTRELQQAGLRDVVIEVVRDFPDFEVEAKVKINHAAMLSPEEQDLLESVPETGLGTVEIPSGDDDQIYPACGLFLLGFFCLIPWVFGAFYLKARNMSARIAGILSLILAVTTGVVVVIVYFS